MSGDRVSRGDHDCLEGKETLAAVTTARAAGCAVGALRAYDCVVVPGPGRAGRGVRGASVAVRPVFDTTTWR
jgi:hypothetical protein